MVAAFSVYLVAAPIVSELRVSRVAEVTSQMDAPTPLSLYPSEWIGNAREQVGHFVVRIQGAGSIIWALEDEGTLSATSLYEVFRPAGLTDRFTHEVVGVERNATVKQGRAPTVVGLGTLAGGLAGTVVVVVIVVFFAALAQKLWLSRVRAWPVCMALTASGLVAFFSEGVPVSLYKEAISIGIVALVYRSMPSPKVQQDALPEVRQGSR